MKRETWKFVIQLITAVLTAIATTLGVTSCMAL
ncbi:smalltalk protein [Xylanibacter rodentium]|jgi:hypothetical protein|uniref:Smalltalk protein n=1 Tax=Xylanibacter rodentium TaxID=2736289 RepID=A0ABX2B1I7_9BACT|nr:smalltalk protein [Xylanibacter rodentium]NPE10069.1 smalltalk protein [Prevotella sp. PJ1A]NPE15378.1 smalltalk protein [Xylanibacter rodentium]NPE38345.1 smalltalk protein [Prevotella sp. PCJ2]